jgi:acetoin utilization deacetylase AcuC-like enzyme
MGVPATGRQETAGKMDLVYDDLFCEHGEAWHPESRQRLDAVLAHLASSGWLERLERPPVPAASMAELSWLHASEYVEALAATSGGAPEALDMDTVATARTWDAARLAAGGCMDAARRAMQGSAPRAFCLVRPPGHHAAGGRAMGFCFLNNAALAAEAALREGAQRVAIVDFDVHHGNGTQDLFYDRRDVMYISLHETGLFPGTGSLDEVGTDDGAGYTVNLPLLAGAGDDHYRRAFEAVVLPCLWEYAPDALIVSAGYDIHHSDPLAHMGASAGLCHAMGAWLAATAKELCQGRIVVVLEGGYSLEWLPVCVENTLRGIEGLPAADLPDPVMPLHAEQARRVADALGTVISTHRERLGLG